MEPISVGCDGLDKRPEDPKTRSSKQALILVSPFNSPHGRMYNASLVHAGRTEA